MDDAVRPAGNDDIPRELAGWYLLSADLRHAVAAVRLHQQRQSLNDPTIARGLWTSAHIAYARCFVDGPTVKLDPAMFDGLPDGRGQAHRFLLFTANKHLAQPLNPSLHVRVDVEHDAQGRAIGIKYARSPSDAPVPNAHDAANLAWLAAEALKRVETIEAGLIARLKERLRASSQPGPGTQAPA